MPARGERHKQALKAAEILGAKRKTLALQDRLISDSVGARLQVARLLRKHRPRMVFTTAGAGVHPDHKAITEIGTHGVFYARLPKWDEVPGGEQLSGTEPHGNRPPLFRTLPHGASLGPIQLRGGCDRRVRSDSRRPLRLRIGDQATLLGKYKAEDR